MPFPTDEQLEILNHDPTEHGRVMAGPGTGKSITSIELLRQITEQHPEIVVRMATFTRAATQDLAVRFADHQLDVPPPTTVHALALSLLMRNRNVGRLPRPLRIPDGYELRRIRTDLARRLRSRGFDDADSRRVRKLEQEMSSRWEALDPDLVLLADENPELRDAYIGEWARHRTVFGYTMLGEIPYRAGTALEDYHPNIGAVELLLVDEYQDLNRADIRFLEGLASRGVRILAIGDDDQSIYSFRMAAPEGIREFPEQFETDNLYSLSECFRCGPEILNVANTLIRISPDREQKDPLVPQAENRGRFIYARFADQEDEARGVAAMIRARIDAGVPPRDIVVLVRSSVDQWSALLTPPLAEEGVELINVDWVDEIMAREEFRERLELLRLAAGDEWTDSLSWWVLLRNWNGVSQSFRDYIYDEAVPYESFADALGRLYPDFPNAPTTRSRNAAERAVGLYRDRSAALREAADDADLAETGWGGWILNRFGRETFEEDEITLLEQVGTYTAGDTNTLRSFLGQLEPVAKDLATQANAVRIMTMTKSKGLTVDTAFVMGVDDSVIPKPDVRDPEEERRLLYVAITRPETLAVLSYAYRRTGPTARQGGGRVGVPRGPSRFFAQLPGNLGEWIPGPDAIRIVAELAGD